MVGPITPATGQRANLRSRSAARRELVRTVNPGHSTTSRLPLALAIKGSEMYGEYAGIAPTGKLISSFSPLSHHPIVRRAAANGIASPPLKLCGPGLSPEAQASPGDMPAFCARGGRDPKAAAAGN